MVAQEKKQAEIRALRELESQRKLERARAESHREGELRRTGGNLVTKCRAQSCRVRVVREEQEGAVARPRSARIMACRTPTSTTPSRHMYPERKVEGRPPSGLSGGVTFRKTDQGVQRTQSARTPTKSATPAARRPSPKPTPR
eukprot:sb/3474111/